MIFSYQGVAEQPLVSSIFALWAMGKKLLLLGALLLCQDKAALTWARSHTDFSFSSSFRKVARFIKSSEIITALYTVYSTKGGKRKSDE